MNATEVLILYRMAVRQYIRTDKGWNTICELTAKAHRLGITDGTLMDVDREELEGMK